MAIATNVGHNNGVARSHAALLSGYAADAVEIDSLSGNLRALRAFASRHNHVRNEVIFAEGDSARTIYRIVNGTVRLCRHTVGGRRHIAEFLMPGDIFGIVEEDEHQLTAEAVTEVTLTAYPRAHFDRLVESSSVARSNLISHLSQNLASAREHHFVLSSQNARERVATFLLDLAARSDLIAGDRLDLPMGRQDMADHLGLTIETVSRAISALKAEGAIAVPNAHQLVLNNVRALSGLANAA